VKKKKIREEEADLVVAGIVSRQEHKLGNEEDVVSKKTKQIVKSAEKDAGDFKIFIDKTMVIKKAGATTALELTRFLVNSVFLKARAEWKRREDVCLSRGRCFFFINFIRKKKKKMEDAASLVLAVNKQFYINYAKWLKNEVKEAKEVQRGITNNKKWIASKLKENTKFKNIRSFLTKSLDTVNGQEDIMDDIIDLLSYELVKVDRIITGKVCMKLKGDVNLIPKSKFDEFNEATKKAITIIYAEQFDEPVYVKKADIKKQELVDDKDDRKRKLRGGTNGNVGRVLKTGSVASWFCQCENHLIISDAFFRRRLSSISLEEEEEEKDFQIKEATVAIEEEQNYSETESADSPNLHRLLWTDADMDRFDLILRSLLVDIFPGLEEVEPMECTGFY